VHHGNGEFAVKTAAQRSPVGGKAAENIVIDRRLRPEGSAGAGHRRASVVTRRNPKTHPLLLDLRGPGRALSMRGELQNRAF
jgi:hypothetical protein